MKLNELKITQKFFAIFCMLLVCVVTSYAIILWFSAQQKNQLAQIEIAGKAKMLAQRFAAMSFATNTDNDTIANRARAEIAELAQQFDQIMVLLKEGGSSPDDENIEIEKVPPEVMLKITDAQEYFVGHKELMNIIIREPRTIVAATGKSDSLKPRPTINSAYKDAIDKLTERVISGTLLNTTNAITDTLVKKSLDFNFFTIMLAMLVCVNFGIIMFTYVLLKKSLKPLEPLTIQINALAQGTIPAPMAIKSMDEIGRITRALNELSKNLKVASQFAMKIGQGELTTTIEVFNGQGELSHALYAMRDNLKQSSQEDSNRNWAAEGLAKFSEILRSSNDVKILSTNIISNLVKYTKSNQGSLFIVNSSDEKNIVLELTATYAFNRKKYIEAKIQPGDGIVGQAYLEKQTVYLKKVPQDYLKITSGLGEGNPKAVLIVPIKVNDDIEGILEMASFTEYQPHEIAFIEKLAENIAITIAATKINERTSTLLKISQQQTEELRAQEEEVRQNMEELTATQEEMSRKDIEMSGQINAINNTMASIEFSMEGIVNNANDKFLNAMDYALDEVKGKHHRIFVDEDYAQSEQYKKFWLDLNKGIAKTGEFQRVGKKGKNVWLSASYTPVLNRDGIPYKVIKFALDITDKKIITLDFESQIKAINKTMACIDFKPDGTIIKANEIFLHAMGYTLDEVVGKNHRIFVDSEYSTSPAYGTFWKELSVGISQSGEFTRLAKNKQKVYLSANYTPISDPAGKVYKVVKFAQVLQHT